VDVPSKWHCVPFNNQARCESVTARPQYGNIRCQLFRKLQIKLTSTPYEGFW